MINHSGQRHFCNLKRWSLFFLILVSLSCGEEEEGGYVEENSFCDDTTETAAVAGLWTLSGQGSRSLCASSEFNTGFEFASVEIPVDQTASQIEAVLGNGAFELYNGSVEGDCVFFSIYEQDGGLIINMNFIGVYSRGKISGLFTGRYSGIENCFIDLGAFDVFIR